MSQRQRGILTCEEKVAPASFLSGVRSGVNGTPTFFINGLRYDGNYDGESMAGALEEANASESQDRGRKQRKSRRGAR
jgi:hypothetical protein